MLIDYIVNFFKRKKLNYIPDMENIPEPPQIIEEPPRVNNIHYQSSEYIKHITERLDRAIQYSEYVANQVDRSIQYSEYVANRLDNAVGYNEYITDILHGRQIQNTKKEEDYNRVYSEIDPYGEEDWTN